MYLHYTIFFSCLQKWIKSHFLFRYVNTCYALFFLVCTFGYFLFSRLSHIHCKQEVNKKLFSLSRRLIYFNLGRVYTRHLNICPSHDFSFRDLTRGWLPLKRVKNTVSSGGKDSFYVHAALTYHSCHAVVSSKRNNFRSRDSYIFFSNKRSKKLYTPEIKTNTNVFKRKP